MSKSKKKRLKRKKNIQKKRKYSPLLTYLGLAAIVLFAIFLRTEDFSTWQKNKAEFQYQGEYQMANFDSYFYLQAAQDLQNGTYDEINEKRRVPNGMERPSIPPLLSILALAISSITGNPLTSVAIFIPPILSALLAIVVFFLSRRLALSEIASLTAAFFSIISLTYIARTRIGVFDTDSLNVVFPLINSYLFYAFIQSNNKQRFRYLGLAILNTFLYLIWWNTASIIVLLSLIVPFLVTGLLFFPTPKPTLKYSVLALTIIASLLFLREQIFSLFELLLGIKTSSFPSNMEVSELNAVNLESFVTKSLDSPLLMLVMLAGLVYFISRHKLKALILSVPILLAFSPFVAGNRFIIFSAPIMAIAIGHAVEFLYQHKKINNPVVAPIITAFLLMLGFLSTYTTVTDDFQQTAAYENVDLLSAIKEYTPPKSDIWTDADLGYQIQYYLDRGTFADGEFQDGGEIYYYLYFPLAADNLALAGNYMQFYHKYGVGGMQELYALFPSVDDTFSFLKHVLSLKPANAQIWLEQQQKEGKLPSSEELSTVEEWLAFLYPKPEKDLYLLTYYKMTQTATWFKQGNSDLITGETKGLPLFLAFNNLTEENGIVGNNQIRIDESTGYADYLNGTRHSFQYLLVYGGGGSNKLSYTNSGELKPPTTQDDSKDDRFAFQWNKELGFGAALSKEMGNTAFVQLFLQNKAADYFEPVALQSPFYQIWKVQGDVYEE